MLVNINALRRIFPENRRFFSPQLYKIFCFVCTRDERILLERLGRRDNEKARQRLTLPG